MKNKAGSIQLVSFEIRNMAKNWTSWEELVLCIFAGQEASKPSATLTHEVQ